MLRVAKSVRIEYDLGICKPDIALLDENGKVVVVIEIVVTHKPEPEAVEYYKEKRIGCLQINVSDFEDCENVDYKLTHPDYVNLCPTPNCKRCGQKMSRAKMVIVNSTCWRCGRDMKIAMIDTDFYGQIIFTDSFTEKEVKLANENGAYVKMNYSNQMKESYFANTCKYCNAFVGQHHIHDYYDLKHELELDLGYKCYNCIELEKQEEKNAQWEKERKLNERIIKDGVKICPKCNGKLVVRKSQKGYFYGCKNYPNCLYTENIKLEEL